MFQNLLICFQSLIIIIIRYILGIQDIISRIDLRKLNISEEIVAKIENSSFLVFDKMSNYFQNVLTKIVSGITAIPSMAIYFVVTILALYFICTDKIYMLDELEHHLPEKWMKKITRTHKRIDKGVRWVFKSSSYFNINIVCNLLDRTLYFVFCRIKCWFPFNNCNSASL